MPFKKGHKGYWLGKTRVLTSEHRLKIAKALKGEKSHFWKGGITETNQIIRESSEYRQWREAVFKRDNYTCQDCGARTIPGKQVFLQADHIKPFSLFPELRFEISNGRTLCLDCHKLTDTYASKIFIKQYA